MPDATTPARPVRVLSIPGGHPYVERLLPDVGAVTYPCVPGSPAPTSRNEAAVRLPDPLPSSGEPAAGVWWPPRALETDWVHAHHDEADVVHLHFGFEGRTPAQLREWADELDRCGLPLVLTVHDLQNPHLVDQSAHEANLAVLVPRAARVLTLTPTAADEVERRFGVRPQVVPHPQIVTDDEILAADDVPAGRDVGVHVGALRAGTDPSAWLGRLADACADQGLDLVVGANDELLAPDAAPERVERLDRIRALLDGRPHARLSVHPRMDDAELHAWVAGLAVAVLPYRHGTHSGWLEMCWDLGTPVLAPRVGHLAAQHDDPAFLAGFDPATGDGVEAGLADLTATGRHPFGDGAARLAERRRVLAAVRAAHLAAYAELAGARALGALDALDGRAS